MTSHSARVSGQGVHLGCEANPDFKRCVARVLRWILVPSGALRFRRIVARPSTLSVWIGPDVAPDARRGPSAQLTLSRGARRSRTSKNATIPSVPGQHDMVDVHSTHGASRTRGPPLTSTKFALAAGLFDKTPLDYARYEALSMRVVACGTSHAAEGVCEVRNDRWCLVVWHRYKLPRPRWLAGLATKTSLVAIVARL